MTTYQIADEPAPSKLARFAVNPVFPLLAVMLGGVWAAWPWFAFNSLAVGSPTRRLELSWLAAGLAALLVLASAIVGGAVSGAISGRALPYVLLAVTVTKLLIVYAVYSLQARTVEIYEYYGGVLRNGVLALLAVMIVGRRLLQDLPPIPLVVLQ